ncbi:MAG TPA: DASS family sodium-coupled anion symporter [Kiritimatiellia bacterium]|nr:DASS family sodium-coupled anion symporter [Kiritimatiellia bacterium]HMO97584.1 DASS family sodium-coupled anion symporter [Kiritimatiellia bacterium]HMP96781.1 DASS family sodium-coupled anion symporter [Kiritimatiellia bacterium]
MMVKVWDPKASQGDNGPFLVRHHYKLLLFFMALAAFVAFAPAPEGLSTEAQRVIGVFTLCVCLWVTGLIPLQITSILAIILLPLLNIMSSAQAFSLFGNQAVFFILGAFILSAALIDCGLSTRLTCKALDRFSASPRMLRDAILFIGAFASFWMSEHAVAAMLFPIVLNMVRAMGLKPMESRFGQSFFFALAWGCIIGGIATYLGGARNPLAAGILFAERGIEISFMRLLSASFPIVVVMLIAAWAILRWCFPAEPVDMEKAHAELKREIDQIGPLSSREVRVGLVGLATILAWIFAFKLVGLANIALLSVAALFMMRLVRWSEIEANVNWGIILMYGGAIALGSALHTTGASTWIVENSIGQYNLTPFQLILILGVLSLLLTEFISNAAVVSVMMPVGLGLADTMGLSLEAVTLAIALPSGLSYVLPMGTPATAIAYSAGYIKRTTFIGYGLIMNTLSLIAFVLVTWLYWPLIGLK